jgi:hypothetical protein
MTDETDIVPMKKPKPSILSILKTVAMVIGIVVFLITVITNLLMVYIIFAPDDFPKPFYVSSYGPGETPQLTTENPNPEQPASEAAPSENSEQATPEGAHSTGETAPEAAPVEGEVMPGEGILQDTGTKIVNLNEPGGRKFIRTNIVLEFAPTDPVYYAEETVVEGGGGEGEGEGAAVVSPREVYLTEFKNELNLLENYTGKI